MRIQQSSRKSWFKKHVVANWELYVLVALPVLWVLVFRYFPMYGAQIAFRRYVPTRGILGSPWVGLDYFVRFWTSYNFLTIIWNTIYLNLYQLVFGFPIPIAMAIALNYFLFNRYKKAIQMVTYLPYFISTVVMVGIIYKLFSARIGIVNLGLVALGVGEVNFLGSAQAFPHVFVWTGIWQTMGWGTIIYLAALSGVDPELHEAAKIDGASIWKRIWHVDLQSIMPTIVILLILRVGSLLDVGFEKILLMQNDLNIRSSEVIQTFVYKMGLASANPNFSYAAAIGLFTSIINFILLVSVNSLSKRVSESSLW